MLGSFSGYLFQRRTAERAAIAARNERLWRERLSACSAFAAAATDLKRGVISAWFRRGRMETEPSAYHEARAEADQLGAVADAAMFRVRLVADDVELHRSAQAVFQCIDPLWDAPDLAALKSRETEFDTALTAFITAAANVLTPPRGRRPGIEV